MGRMETFTQRAIGKREHLYEPQDDDHGANWDYLAAIAIGFGIGTAIFFAFLATLFIRF